MRSFKNHLRKINGSKPRTKSKQITLVLVTEIVVDKRFKIYSICLCFPTNENMQKSCLRKISESKPNNKSKTITLYIVYRPNFSDTIPIVRARYLSLLPRS